VLARVLSVEKITKEIKTGNKKKEKDDSDDEEDDEEEEEEEKEEGKEGEEKKKDGIKKRCITQVPSSTTLHKHF
jgi:hypothetical protein